MPISWISRFIPGWVTSWSWEPRPVWMARAARFAFPDPLAATGAAKAADASGAVRFFPATIGVAERLTSSRKVVLWGCSPTRPLAAGAGRVVGLPAGWTIKDQE